MGFSHRIDDWRGDDRWIAIALLSTESLMNSRVILLNASVKRYQEIPALFVLPLIGP
jgi:hypothetical protein